MIEDTLAEEGFPTLPPHLRKQIGRGGGDDIQFRKEIDFSLIEEASTLIERLLINRNKRELMNTFIK